MTKVGKVIEKGRVVRGDKGRVRVKWEEEEGEIEEVKLEEGVEEEVVEVKLEEEKGGVEKVKREEEEKEGWEVLSVSTLTSVEEIVEEEEEWKPTINKRKSTRINEKSQVTKRKLPNKPGKLENYFQVTRVKPVERVDTPLEVLYKVREDHWGLSHSETYHNLTEEGIIKFRSGLLGWYEINKRSLPWRKELGNLDKEELNDHAYRVWVSEIMLQQTQVETVKSYFHNWVNTFPTIRDLAKADLEKVNRHWSGLGYYQRARRLHEGAQYVVNNYDGVIPSDHPELLKLPGVGPYTAGAIGSIAFNRPYETVDGNVTRVLTRVLGCSGDIRGKPTTTLLWETAKLLLDPTRPGDFNQAYMDLGSQVCTPTNPNCGKCPLVQPPFTTTPLCKAYLESKVTHSHLLELEDLDQLKLSSVTPVTPCSLCTPLDCDLHHPTPKCLTPVRYPYKSPAKPPRPQECITLVIQRPTTTTSSSPYEILLLRRPDKGLLAGLWMFPTYDLPPSSTPSTPTSSTTSTPPPSHLKSLQSLLHDLTPYLPNPSSTPHPTTPHYCGTTLHKFSHIHQQYHVYTLTLIPPTITPNSTPTPNTSSTTSSYWCPHLPHHPLPTAYRKVYQLALPHLKKLN